MTTTSTAIVTPAIDAAVLEITRELIGIGRQIDALQMKLFKLAIACDGRSDGEETPGKLTVSIVESGDKASGENLPFPKYQSGLGFKQMIAMRNGVESPR